MRYCGIILALLLCSFGDAVDAHAQGSRPTVQLDCPAASSNPIRLRAQITGADPSAKLSYEWAVSAGKIIGGQGTPAVDVDLVGLNLVKVTATVVVGGLGDDRTHATSCTFPAVFIYDPQFGQFNLSSVAELRPVLDNFAVELRHNPDTTGYLVVYAGRRAYVGEALERAFEMTEYLTKARGVGGGRLVVVDGGHREEPTAELYLVPKKPEVYNFTPRGTPTLNPSEVMVTPKGSPGRSVRKRRRNLTKP